MCFDGTNLRQSIRLQGRIPFGSHAGNNVHSGVFAPVRRDNQILVDGGLVDNLPADVVRGMGADIVIGVHLQISAESAGRIGIELDSYRGQGTVSDAPSLRRGRRILEQNL